MDTLRSALRVSQSEMGRIAPGPPPLMRAAYRLPLWGYRLGLGDMLNRLHIGVLTTLGRTSGQPRFVALEYRTHGSKLYIISAWGEYAQWVRNLEQHPRVTLRRGRMVQAAQAEIVTDRSEVFRALNLFYRTNPGGYERMFRRLSPRDSMEALSLPQIANRVLVVRVRPEPGTPVLPPAPASGPEVAAALGAGLLLAVILGAAALAFGRARRAR